MSDTSHEKRLMVREQFARQYAILIAVMAFAVIWKCIPTDIDFNSPTQALYLGQLTGAVIACLTAACMYYFHVSTTATKSTLDKDGDGKPDA